MTDQYPNAHTDPFIYAGGQGQPQSTTGWNAAGGNYKVLPQTMTFNSTAAQEFEIQLPPARVDYVDVHISGEISGSGMNTVFITDLINKLQITDNLKNTPLDLAGPEIRAYLAISAQMDLPHVAKLTKLTATGGSIDAWFRLTGPFQLSAMGTPVLKMQMAIPGATTVALTVRFAVMNSDIQYGDLATGYYYVTDTRAPQAYNRFAMGASMVQDIFVFTGAVDAVTKLATANVPANQQFNYDVPTELALIKAAGSSLIPGVGLTDTAPLVVLLDELSTPYAVPHVDIAHNANRELIVERAVTSDSNTIVICRNQVIG